LFPTLYAVIDITPNSTAESASYFAQDLVDDLVKAGVRIIQLRAKHSSARFLFDISSTLVYRLSGQPVRIIINDRPDIARLANAAGVHVGQEDLPVTAARQICPAPQWVGISTHNLEQLHDAINTSADYIAVGPIHPTKTKENPEPVVGLDLIRAARKLTRKPLIAIGGITINSASEVFRAGADSVAVISDLQNAPDPAQRAREYLTLAAQAIAARSSRGE
jgi:thiamine-phosphate pyrophosphorylase